MTTGIYSLYWEEQDLIYIGLSQNIENRFKEHLNNLKRNKHSNYKVQNAFNNYSIPELIILEKCLIEELNAKEISWTNEFDSINNGLNIIEAGTCSGFGQNHGSSKYTNEQIIAVFKLLINNEYIPFKKISLATGVSINSVELISRGHRHTWLKEAYPQEYIKLTNLIGSRNNPKEYNIEMLSPTGNISILNTITEFSIKHSIHRGNLYKVIKGERQYVNGWRIN